MFFGLINSRLTIRGIGPSTRYRLRVVRKSDLFFRLLPSYPSPIVNGFVKRRVDNFLFFKTQGGNLQNERFLSDRNINPYNICPRGPERGDEKSTIKRQNYCHMINFEFEPSCSSDPSKHKQGFFFIVHKALIN